MYMKAIAIEQFGGREVMKMMDLPRPLPKPNEILVKIHAAGVNPVDWKIRQGLFEGRIPHEFPIILGWDSAGIVEEVGSMVRGIKLGDEVMAPRWPPKIPHLWPLQNPPSDGRITGG